MKLYIIIYVDGYYERTLRWEEWYAKSRRQAIRWFNKTYEGRKRIAAIRLYDEGIFLNI